MNSIVAEPLQRLIDIIGAEKLCLHLADIFVDHKSMTLTVRSHTSSCPNSVHSTTPNLQTLIHEIESFITKLMTLFENLLNYNWNETTQTTQLASRYNIQEKQEQLKLIFTPQFSEMPMMWRDDYIGIIWFGEDTYEFYWDLV